jgi:nucleotide-binding universal stress UspA family protein
MKVLLAVDGSPYTKCLLDYIAQHDQLLRADTQYSVITVVPPVPPHAASYLSAGDLKTYYEDQVESVLAPVRSFIAQQGWSAEFQHAVGRAPDLIAAAATQGGFDLLVMGSHGNSALGSLVLGSVTTRVLAQCKTPVLIIR